MVEEREDPRIRAGRTKREKARARLLDAAESVLAEQGVSADVASIAERADVSVPTFYNFYRSRNELCCELLTEIILNAAPEEHGYASFDDAAKAVTAALRGKTALIRAALIGRLEYRDENWAVPRHLVTDRDRDPVQALKLTLGEIKLPSGLALYGLSVPEGTELGVILNLMPACLWVLDYFAADARASGLTGEKLKTLFGFAPDMPKPGKP